MKKLIRLELQKNNWKPYWITTSITTLAWIIHGVAVKVAESHIVTIF